MNETKQGNMYEDAIYRWNIMVGCYYQCSYCKPSFQRQMKRQKHNCMNCYNYIPHFHPERLNNKLPKTKGDEFIWCCSSSDISFARKHWITAVLEKVRTYPNRTFFFQSKNPAIFNLYQFPDNVILGTTLETNRDYIVSKAPLPRQRALEFSMVDHPRKFITIEPIMQFDLYPFVLMIKGVHPERVYIGYDTKNCGLLEPRLAQTKALIQLLQTFTHVKLKYMKEREG